MPKSEEGFLWTSTGTSSGLESEAVVPAADCLKQDYEVIVIGAGFAGLTAARDIGRHANTLLLDARDRIGGRTWTAKALGQEFEMGGTWVHWHQPHIYSELVRYDLHKNLKTTNGTLAPENAFFRHEGQVSTMSGEEFDARFDVNSKIFFNIDGLTLKDYLPRPHEPLRHPEIYAKYDVLSVQDRLNQLNISAEDKAQFSSVLGSFGTASPSDVGFMEAGKWFALFGENAAGLNDHCVVYKLGAGGTTSLARAMLDDFDGDIALSSIVAKIEQGDHGVRILLKDGRTFTAKYAVSTIPLNVMSDIQFSPPLSKLKTEAAAQGHICKGAKVHFEISPYVPAFMATSSWPSTYCYTFSDHHGSDGRKTYSIGFGNNNSLPDLKDSERVCEEYKKLVPGAEISAYLTHDWAADPYAKGLYCCYRHGFSAKYLADLQQPHGRIYMASADWADGWRGFIDGAIEQGTKAGREVLKALGKHTGKQRKSLQSPVKL